jgi:hypothetical protein
MCSVRVFTNRSQHGCTRALENDKIPTEATLDGGFVMSEVFFV